MASWWRQCSSVGATVMASLLLTGACGSSSPTQPESPVPGARHGIVALGDSLTAGPGLASAETYPALLQGRIRAAGLPHVVINEGVSGDTTGGALSRLDRALRADTGILIVALGINDGFRGTALGTIERNLETIVERAEQRGITVLLCAMDVLPTHGLQYSLDFHQIYPDVANKYRTPLVPFLLANVYGRPELNLADGIHPNAAGHRRIADTLWPYLQPLLR